MAIFLKPNHIRGEGGGGQLSHETQKFFAKNACSHNNPQFFKSFDDVKINKGSRKKVLFLVARPLRGGEGV